MATQVKAVLGVDKLDAVADRGYYSGEEIKACDDAGIAVTLPHHPHVSVLLIHLSLAFLSGSPADQSR